MAITTTTNKSLVKVTVGTESGTWGPYINGNQDLLDGFLGGIATIALTNSPVTLSSAQYQQSFIRFTGAITANIAITFPAVGSFYTIINDCTNSSNFNLTALTTATGGRQIGIPPGTMTPIMTDGSNARFTTLPAAGTLWHYVGSSTPAWVSACTVPPWLYCNGASFSSATYPTLNAILSGTTLPDLRGRYLCSLNDGTGRIPGADTNLTGGGAATQTLSQANMPNYNLSVSDPGHVHTQNSATVYGDATASLQTVGGGANYNTNSHNTLTGFTGITVNSGGSGVGVSIIPPTQAVGITLVRAA